MLDAALIRPGRLDVHVEFKMADRIQAEQLFRRFYPATAKEPEGDDKIEPLLIELSVLDNMEENSKENNFQVTTSDISSFSYPQLSKRQLHNLAKAFSLKVPDFEISMASIQGHLMRFKTNPYEAIRCADSWISEERKRIIRKRTSLTDSEKGSAVSSPTPPSED